MPGIKLVNMAANWCMVFKVFDILLLTFLHKYFRKSLKSVQASYGT